MIGTQQIDAYARAISDVKQHSVLDGASAGTTKRYQVLHKDYTDPDALRKLAAQIKDHTLSHLDQYLEQAEKSLTARGVNVHFAATGDDAKQTILNILRQHEVTQLTKAGAFEALGIEPVVESVEDFRKYMAAYVTESADLLKGAGFKPE